MVKIALVSADIKSRETYLDFGNLPDNYMADFSLMGFVVDRYDDALKLITSAGYTVNTHRAGTDISLENPKNLLEIRALLLKNNICCDYSDIADTLYQA